jgi:hypothetical protein
MLGLTWPPKPNRVADNIFLANMGFRRDRTRVNSDAVGMAAGTVSSVAVSTVPPGNRRRAPFLPGASMVAAFAPQTTED